jgi:uncharacterized membrane protein
MVWKFLLGYARINIKNAFVMPKFILTLVLTFLGTSAFACPFCNKKIADGIYNSQFYPNLFTMLSAFIVLAIVVAILTAVTAKRHKTRVAAISNKQVLSPVPLTTASMVLGIGMGGFVDGIVLHQMLQVHEMLSNKIPATEYIGKSINMFWDGIFHFFCMVVVLIGIILMWKLLSRKDVNRSGKLLGGGLLLGWGLFNIVEGVIDHQILKLHNVIELAPNHDIANFAFLGLSVVMIIIGYAFVNSENKTRYTS